MKQQPFSIEYEKFGLGSSRRGSVRKAWNREAQWKAGPESGCSQRILPEIDLTRCPKFRSHNTCGKDYLGPSPVGISRPATILVRQCRRVRCIRPEAVPRSF